ncbi:hypothetical protein J4219_00065 [Candidatus Woesearchaeota archaeon]|nr:hypothetical protein [Candidatus Woesearchaeota archaeon]
MIKTLWEILVPKCDNFGKEYDLEHHHKWDEHVRNLAGGLTILKSAKGQWISPDGQLFSEPMIPVRIYCDEISIDTILDYTILHYEQKAVMAYEVSRNVKLKHKQ